MVKRILLLVALLALAGCQHQGSDIVHAQTPGHATGAGSELTGPNNSATGSSQESERVTVYQDASAPAAEQPHSPRTDEPAAEPAAGVPPPAAGKPVLVPSAAGQLPRPAWIYEKTSTQLGQHQDAAGIVKVAVAASSWSGMRWMGILCVLGCIGGLLYSHGNPEGYPVIFWKVGAIGVVFIVFADNPAWLLLLILPLGFYAAQKMNLLRIP